MPARRRRTLGAVKRFPVAVQLRDMRAVGIGDDVESDERIVLATDRLRHLFELDPVVAQLRFGAQPQQHFAPQGEEARRSDALREIPRQERRVVIAKFLAEPAQPPRTTPRLDGKRRDERGRTVGVTSDDDCRHDAVALADMAMPGLKPFIGLERRTLGDLLETAPFTFDRLEARITAEA